MLKPLTVKYWQDNLYKGAIDPANETVKKVYPLLTEDSVVLDLGAGAGEVNKYNIKGRCKKIIGVDYDPRVMENPLLDEAHILEDWRIPLPDNSVDIIFSIYVFEHVAQVSETVSEIKRVLKPGGVIIALTPSRWHYVSMVASMTPLKFHKWINKRRGFDGDDTFPTTYLLNTPSAVRNAFGNEFDWEFDQFETQPNYLKFNVALFMVGVLYERTVNAVNFLSNLRVNIIMTGRRKG